MAVVMDKLGEETKHETERFAEKFWWRCLCVSA
jgi:hypothetical protein